MARFILDVETEYDKNNKIITDVKKGCEIFADEYLSQQFNGGVVSITCIERLNGGRSLTKSQLRLLRLRKIKLTSDRLKRQAQASEQKG